MYIKTSGKPSNVPIRLCKEAVKFYGRKLISNNLYHKISLTLEFEEFPPRGNDYAYCEWEFDNNRSKDFIITIDKKLNKKQMLLALAHEMVHVKQYARGELKDYMRVNKCKWLGEKFDLDQIDYWDQPWEIEAHGREKGLYLRFLESMKEI